MECGKIEKKRINISNIINAIVISIFIALVLNQLTSRSDKLFETIGYRSYTVLSGSMEPKFYPGDVVKKNWRK